MMPIQLTHDENVDGSIHLLSEGGAGIYKLAKFIKAHRHKENTKNILADALSLYRGGQYSPENQDALAEFLDALRGSNTDIPPFEWHGNKSDLSYFWKTDATSQSTSLPVSAIDDIKDTELKAAVKKTFAKSYAEGLVEYDRKTDSLLITDKGKSVIMKTEFIENRLNAELARSQGIDEKNLSDAAKRMVDRGLDGYDFVTINKKTLVVSENGKELFCRVPGTAGKDYIKLQSSEYFSLNDKSFELYLSQSKTYTVYDINGVEKGTVSGTELVSHYDIKTTQEKKAYATELQPEENPITSAFLEKEGYKEIEGATFKRDDFVFVCDDNFEVYQYRVAYSFENTETGEVLYHLKPCEEGLPELVHSEKFVGKNLFANRTEAQAALTTDAGKRAALEAGESIAKQLHTIKIASDVATTVANPTTGVATAALKVLK